VRDESHQRKQGLIVLASEIALDEGVQEGLREDLIGERKRITELNHTLADTRASLEEVKARFAAFQEMIEKEFNLEQYTEIKQVNNAVRVATWPPAQRPSHPMGPHPHTPTRAMGASDSHDHRQRLSRSVPCRCVRQTEMGPELETWLCEPTTRRYACTKMLEVTRAKKNAKVNQKKLMSVGAIEKLMRTLQTEREPVAMVMMFVTLGMLTGNGEGVKRAIAAGGVKLITSGVKLVRTSGRSRP
jgi:hypothetical protein